jgi:cellulose synthase operon protein C
VRLADTLLLWFGRVEVVLAGADEALREGEEALAANDAMRARGAARSVLDKLPGSPIGLALLADACDMAGLEAELALTLEELASRVGSRAEVWVRLGRARLATQSPLDEVRDAYARALAVAEPGSQARREALLFLADIDIAQGDGARADLWLDRAASDKSPDVVQRRVSARLAQGDIEGAKRWLERMDESPADGAAALVRGCTWATALDPRAFDPLLRAMILDVHGASETLSSTLAWIATDVATRERVRLVVTAKGEASLARWRAAFARAEGRRDEARQALAEAVRAKDASAAMPLLDAALEDRDHSSLSLALSLLNPEEALSSAAKDARRLVAPLSLADPNTFAASLDALALVASERARAWADRNCEAIAEAWIPEERPAAWDPLLARLDAHARDLHDLETTAALALLSAERGRPVRIAVVGEFNAGKSTFINALVGADIAPTGVLPTTATLHHLRYAQDAIARIALEDGGDRRERIVPVTELRAALKAEVCRVKRVEILLPIASLTRVEILDTPGFNAPNESHAEAARDAFAEADAVIWLLDAGQPLKRTERVILEEAREQKLPVQILVNKADRLSKDDLAKVMNLVEVSLAEIGVRSWSPPLALSARLALEGKLGDTRAFEASGWPAVSHLIDEQFLARSEELKERALRRRAALAVHRLRAHADALASEEDKELLHQRERSKRFSSRATALDRELDTAAEKLTGLLTPAAEAKDRDLALVFMGRDARTTATDSSLARYRADRCLVRLAPPLADALARLADNTDLSSADLLPTARALVRGFAASGEDAPVSALALAAISTLVEHLGALALLPSAAPQAGGRARELAALAKALEATRAESPVARARRASPTV